MMTSTVIAMAIEEELLSWETNLADIFDFNIDNKFKNVTIAMLGAHQSGITDDLGQFNQGQVWSYLWNLSGNIPLEQYWIQRPHVQEGRLTVAREILKPRSEIDSYYGYSYNNINYIILGAILERIYQKDWEEIITEKLFAPLNMDTAGFGPQASNTNTDPDQPWGHTLSNNQLMPYFLDNPPNLTYFEGMPAVVLSQELKLTTDWDNFINATIRIINASPGDTLTLSNPLNANILSYYNADIGELSLSGLAPTNSYQTALRSVSYLSASSTLSDGLRQINFMASDGQFITDPETLTLKVVASNTPLVSPTAVPSEPPLTSNVPIETPITVPQAVSEPVSAPSTMPEMPPVSFPVSMPNAEAPVSIPINSPIFVPNVHVPINNHAPNINTPKDVVSIASTLSASWFGTMQQAIQLVSSPITTITSESHTLSIIGKSQSFNNKSQTFNFSNLANSVDTVMSSVPNQLLFWQVGWTFGKQIWRWLTNESSNESNDTNVTVTELWINQDISQIRLNLKHAGQYQAALATVDAVAAEAYDLAFNTYTETLDEIIQQGKIDLRTFQTLKEDVDYLFDTLKAEYKAQKQSANVTTLQTIFFKPMIDIKKSAMPAHSALTGINLHFLINETQNKGSSTSHLLAK